MTICIGPLKMPFSRYMNACKRCLLHEVRDDDLDFDLATKLQQIERIGTHGYRQIAAVR
jgi:hypothetical protein